MRKLADITGIVKAFASKIRKIVEKFINSNLANMEFHLKLVILETFAIPQQNKKLHKF